MSLWGNSDNVTSAGLVSLDYDTKIVTGSASPATAFGAVGSAKTGDVIRFGIRGAAGAGTTYFGDAVIVGITSARVLTIGSTAGLTGAAIGSTDFYISELPSYTVDDHQWSNKHDTVATYKTIATSTALTATGVGVTNIAFRYKDVEPALAIGGPGYDSLLIDSTNIQFLGLGTGTATVTQTSGINSDRFYVATASIPNISANSTEIVISTDVAGTDVESKHKVTEVAATYVGVGVTNSVAVAAGSKLLFHSPHLVSLASTVPSAISESDTLTFQRKSGGYDRQIYGISVADANRYDDSSGKFRTSGSGWVGVTTYTDCDGQFRVKSEILVAIGPGDSNGNTGITTGANGIGYPTNKG